jgi:uncharacterized radical SAM superfamily Fe-S cluster-containing enzyme
MRVLRRARGLCPECLRRIDGRYVEDGAGNVHLEKNCPEHGSFRVPVWTAMPGTPRFGDWKNAAPPDRASESAGAREKGCPFDCGLCADHARQTCCALVEVTRRCDMHCPVCYASAGGDAPDPPLSEVEKRLAALFACAGPVNVQLSGGEPSVRDDLPDIIRLVRARGFPFVQLNTNGLRLAREAGYAERLKEAGLDLVYLQLDGVSEDVFLRLRGAPYAADKERATENCIRAGLSLVFVMTAVRGVNDGEFGALLRKALACGPPVRGLHVQPAASFGRYPWKLESAPRLTLPELMHALEEQSGGMVRAGDFRPPGSEHALCSFSALYRRIGDAALERISGARDCCASASSETPARRAAEFTARHWGAPSPQSPLRELQDGFDAFLASSGLRQRFTLSAMAFQDVCSLDLERVRRCHIHIVTEGGGRVPFCVYNLTSAAGVPLRRKYRASPSDGA